MEDDASPFIESRSGTQHWKRSNYMTQIPGTENYVTKLVKRHTTATYAIIAIVAIVLLLSVVILGASIGAATSSRAAVCTSTPPLLIISLDGFRNDYLTRDITPSITSLGSSGVRAQYMIPVFPSMTFPSHYSIVTGLYPENHGIVSNNFYDRILKKTFSIFSMNSTEPEWWLGEPIWVTAKKQNLRTFVYFWPGSEVEIQGIRPDRYYKYNRSVPFSERVNTVLDWVDLPNDQRPQFMAVYFNQPDHYGHIYGPNSTQVNGSLREVDAVIGQLIDGLKQRGAYDCVNIMLLTDHGMATVFPSKVFALGNQLLPTSIYNLFKSHLTYGVFSNLYAPSSSVVKTTYDALKKNISSLGAPFDVYLRDDAPPEYHIGKFNQQRYGDIFIIAQTGSYLKKTTASIYTNMGTHGYNNNDSLMRAIFLAHGPAFKTSYSAAPFENVELYNLMCSLLKITPAPNNGTVGALDSLLVS